MGSQQQHDGAESPNGFTLIELLVGLGLMGMASTLLLLGLQSAGLIAARERTASSGLEQVIAAQRLLRSTVERLRPVSRADSAVPVVELRGGAQVLAFIGPSDDRSAPVALQRYRLIRTTGGDLVLYSASTRQAVLDKEGKTLAGWTPATLLHDVASVSMDYFGVLGTDQAPRWHEDWLDRPRPPELIRIRVRFARNDNRTWPDLVIRPRATMNSTCTTDGTYNRCSEGL